MTQQQIQQPYQVPPQQPYPPQGYPAQPGYPPQGYPAPMPAYPGFPVQPTPPQQPLAQGTLDDFYNQPSGGGGKSISWQGKEPGTTYVGIVARDVNNGDVKQQTDFVTKAPLFYADGRPKFTMNIPLKVQPSQEFPEGEATWYVKGQARDELVRAMAEVGLSGSPKAGALVQVTLTQRKPSSRGLNPTNVFAVRYVPDASGAGAPSPVPAPPSQAQAPVGAGQPNYQVPWQPPAQQPAVPTAPQYAPPQQPQQPQYQQPVQAPQQQLAPAQTPPPPAGLSPEQQALMARMGAAQQAPA